MKKEEVEEILNNLSKEILKIEAEIDKYRSFPYSMLKAELRDPTLKKLRKKLKLLKKLRDKIEEVKQRFYSLDSVINDEADYWAGWLDALLWILEELEEGGVL